MAAQTQNVSKTTPSKTSDGKAGKGPVKTVEKEKKEKVERIEFPLVGNQDPKIYPFPMREVDGKKVATPVDFNREKHIPLRRKDFVSGEAYFTYRAEEAQKLADHFRNRASEEAKLGSGKERSAAKKLLAMQSKMAELTKLLSGQGVDVAALLAQAKQQAEATGEKAETAKA